MRKPHILIVDDDAEIRTLLGRFFGEHGFCVSSLADGRTLATRDLGSVDVILLDIMLPHASGLDLCRTLRACWAVPIIMVTAVTGETDRIVGLELGADDYVTKPFNPRELLARVRALLRRASGAVSPALSQVARCYQFEGWRIDARRRHISGPAGDEVTLSSAEFDALVAFVEHPQTVLTRDDLLRLARGRVAQIYDRSIDVLISRLRRKIEDDPAQPRLIKTVRTGGYVFTATVSREGAPP